MKILNKKILNKTNNKNINLNKVIYDFEIINNL